MGAIKMLTFILSLSIAWADVNAYFTPGQDLTKIIVQEIDNAQSEVLVQAYNYTDDEISTALINAKGRGCRVVVVLDRVSPNQKGSQAEVTARASIPIRVDRKHKIQHNKIIVIDGKVVITGSFNFTNNAQHYNAENLVIITNAPTTSDRFRDNFLTCWEHSEPYQIPALSQPPVRRRR